MKKKIKKSPVMNHAMYREKSEMQSGSGCPFCEPALKRDVLELSNGTSFLRKNKMPIYKGAHMYVLIESLEHQTHLEDMEVKAAQDVLAFAFRAMAWVSEQHQSRYVLLLKNRGLLSGGSQPHPHMQVLALPEFDSSQVDFLMEEEWYREPGIAVGVKTDGNYELYQLVLQANSKGATSERTVAVLQELLKWTAATYQNYNLAHWREGGQHYYKIIPRWAGSVFETAYNHPVKLDLEGLEQIREEILVRIQS